jgi:DNA (cytosine-5)-methyltransferase 1
MAKSKLKKLQEWEGQESSNGKASLGHYGYGTKAPWYEGRNLSEEERNVFRERSRASQAAKNRALQGEGPAPLHPINTPRFNPETLMPQQECNGLRTLSLFSGCGGLDLGFDRAGFSHVASYEVLSDAGFTLIDNRPRWAVFSGPAGDVTRVDWREYRNRVDVIHGGPPCQPFSSAGRQKGQEDERNLFPEFIRAVLAIKPLAFLAENVRALGNKKFKPFLHNNVLSPLSAGYHIQMFELSAASFGVPQVRTRLFFVGLRRDLGSVEYISPKPTHYTYHLTGQENNEMPLLGGNESSSRHRCMGAREALGLSDIGFDALAPTLRSGLTGPRHTTSVLSSVSALKIWDKLRIWPNGVAVNREQARLFVPENGHFRLSIADCAILQGFPDTWKIHGAVYMATGQIGNSVVPPVAYQLAVSISRALSSKAAAAS